MTVFAGTDIQGKTARITPETPEPARYVIRGIYVFDRLHGVPVFFRGIGYSPYHKGETPIYGDMPGNDNRYQTHIPLMQRLGVNYLHVFPIRMPPKFFSALDRTDLCYGQDIWIDDRAEDFLSETYQSATLSRIKEAIDHTYAVGRPDRLVLFSIGDELQPKAILRTDARHPQVHDYAGKHIVVTGRTPTEVAIARLIDQAMEYELTRYSRRHLYCHTSFTHIGPLNRSDIQVPQSSLLIPDMGDLVCLNIYTYARGVITSPPGSKTGRRYQGYLEELSAMMQKPIFITQIGLSTSPFEPKPWAPGFGGHRVTDVPAIFRSVWQDITTAHGHEKFCGVAFFELHDEWWKGSKQPMDSKNHDQDDPEEWFGIYEINDENRLIPKGKIPDTLRDLYVPKSLDRYSP
ncbi:MAG: hypothetical protein HQK77_13200 [Desulfobacterales bacterium]|nr:hypothetical protein [Desulfobacterales bacterium]